MRLAKVFGQRNNFQHLTPADVFQQCKTLSMDFIHQLERYPQDFIDFINHPTPKNLTELQKVTLTNMVYIYSNSFNNELELLQLNLKCEDSWICQSLLVPYQKFIRKVIHSSDLYDKVRIINNGWNKDSIGLCDEQSKNIMRANPQQFFNLELMFYTINLLTELFSILKHVPNLGRYYLHSQGQNIQPFVKTASYQTVLLYFALKFMINEMIFKYGNYITNEQEDRAFRDILTINLDSINQNMKHILLNKYFNLIDKGIKVTLFELDRQNQQNRQLLQNILGSSAYTRQHKSDNYSRNRRALANKIFREGKFDRNLFEESIYLINSSVLKQQCLEDLENKENIGEDNILCGSFLYQALQQTAINTRKPLQSESCIK